MHCSWCPHTIMDGSNALLREFPQVGQYDRRYRSPKVCFGPPLKGWKISPEFRTSYPADMREETNYKDCPFRRAEGIALLSTQSLLVVLKVCISSTIITGTQLTPSPNLQGSNWSPKMKTFRSCMLCVSPMVGQKKQSCPKKVEVSRRLASLPNPAWLLSGNFMAKLSPLPPP